MRNKYYGRGTKFYVTYKHEGIVDEELCILADTYEVEFLFQVVVITGYYAGVIEGYIEYQFKENDNRKKFCTIHHIKKQLKKRIYSEIIDFNIIV